jgi:chromosome segregation ATPase
MTRANKALAIMVVAALGLWGCAQGPSNNGGSSGGERIKVLEGELSKLKEDYRATASARDGFKKDLQTKKNECDHLRAELQQQQARIKDRDQLVRERDELRAQLQACMAERDDLRAQLHNCTGERDSALAQFEQFRKGIRSLLGQADAAATGTLTEPAISVVDKAGPGKS